MVPEPAARACIAAASVLHHHHYADRSCTRDDLRAERRVFELKFLLHQKLKTVTKTTRGFTAHQSVWTLDSRVWTLRR